MLIDSGLPKFLWLEAMQFAMWIRNRTTTHALGGKTPYEALYGVKPDMSNLHLWGSRVWVRDLTAGKLDPRGREGRFVGYDSESKGYRVYWIDSRTVGVERDLVFEDRPITNELVLLPDPSVIKSNPQPPQPSQPSETTPETTSTSEPTSVAEPERAKAEAEPPTQKRTRTPSRYVRDILEGKGDGGTARGKSQLPKGIQTPTGMAAASDKPPDQPVDESFPTNLALASLSEVTFDDDPKNLKEAMERSDWPEWQKAIDDELALMAKYQVWDVVDEPVDKNIVGCRWVFRIKRDANGRVQKYKARLVAQGFTQIYGIDFP